MKRENEIKRIKETAKSRKQQILELFESASQSTWTVNEIQRKIEIPFTSLRVYLYHLKAEGKIARIKSKNRMIGDLWGLLPRVKELAEASGVKVDAP